MRLAKLGNQNSKRPHRPHSLQTRRNIGIAVGGNKHWNWQGGKNHHRVQFYRSLEYRLWREAVFARDGYTCQFCGVRGMIRAHHIKPRRQHLDIALKPSNGITLCLSCHQSTIWHEKEYEEKCFIALGIAEK